MKLYIMRHCERDIQNCSFESPLIDIGHINAVELCKSMNSFNITKVFSSPFLRTIQTSHYYSKEKKIPINIDYSLCEYVDTHEKHLMYSLNNYKIYDEWRKTYNIDTSNMFYDKFDNGECINRCISRIYRFLNYIENNYGNSEENILLVTHMSVVNVILAISNQKLKEGFDIDKYYPMGLITKVC